MSLLRALPLLGRRVPRSSFGLPPPASASAPGEKAALALAAAAGRPCLEKVRPRWGRKGHQTPPRTRRAAGGGAAAITASLGLSVFSLFSRETEKEKGVQEEEKEKGVQEEEKEATKEDTIIYLLKTAKLNIMKGELDKAEQILHEAARLSHESDNRNAIIYTYDLMANLAFIRGQMEQSEKLFKATMSYLLAGDTKEDDNAIIEISLKLTSIYAAQNQHDLALTGYQFCLMTLEEKVAKQKDVPADVLPEAEKDNTRLLLGMTLDSYARYLLANNQAAAAQKMYERALQIAVEVQGETHPQTVVLMNDLATALDSQGLYDEAHARVARASELARQTEHPEAHIVLNNLAGILMHKEDYAQAGQVYKAALKQAEKVGDKASAQYVRKEIAELVKRQRKRGQPQKEDGAEAGKA
ncbi:tetratricopeptide repeat protein 19, mitochondrial [Pogona vitticeps]